MLDRGEIESHKIPDDVKDDFIRSILQRASTGEALQLFKMSPNALTKQTDAVALPKQADADGSSELKPTRE